jgi:branched-chain amino acid transport system substrate-binding protein
LKKFFTKTAKILKTFSIDYIFSGERELLDSRGLTKIQAIALIIVIVVASVAGVVYVFYSGETQPADTIKIGVCGDLDMTFGSSVLQGAILAAEQVNAEGGILGREVEIISEDSDAETSGGDITVATSALARLITYHKVDYIITSDSGIYLLAYQDVVAEHKKILFAVRSISDTLTQRVLDDYDNYKYFFRIFSGNSTSALDGMIDCLLTLKEYTGFNKVGYLVEDITAFDDIVAGFDYYLPEVHGFDLVYKGRCPPGTVDFTSYLWAIEVSGAEILYPVIVTQAATPFVKEWHDQEAPFVVWGSIGMAQEIGFWDATEGKCEHVAFVGVPTIAGYPLTTKTVPTRDAFLAKWGEAPNAAATAAYDVIRFILYDALKRADTTETDAVIEALEETDVETSMAERFVFTLSHDVMIGEAGPNRPEEDYMLVLLVQWQDGTQVPVYPKQVMDEAGATYTFPDWPGPWDNLD